MNRAQSSSPTVLTFVSIACAGSLAALSGCHDNPASKPETVPQAAATASVPNRSNVLAEAFNRAESAAKGRLGVAVLHVETGERIAFHSDERFPMQSVFKLPLAVTMLSKVDAGDAKLDDVVTIKPQDLRSGPANALADVLPKGGTRTVRQLIETMIIDSDNTAADLLLARVGGAEVVTRKLHALGIDGVDVSRSEAELMLDMSAVTSRPPRATWTRDKLEELCDATPVTAKRAALAAYLKDPRDTSTPAAMASLLLRVYKKDALAAPSAAFLVETLEKTATGKKRLKAGLPEGTVIAHKTGSSGTFEGVAAASNDVGIVTLPGNAGHVIIAAFLREAKGDDDARDAAIAAVGNAVFEAYATH